MTSHGGDSTRVGPHDGAVPGDSEFTFELAVCRWAELAWHPAEGSRPAIVARQLGVDDRRWDTVVVEVDPAGLAARRRLSEDGLDSDLIHVVRNASAEWAYYREALPDPGYPWRYVRAAVNRAADRGLIERRKRGGQIELRRLQPYPEWIRRIVAVENKPDLDASAARALPDQLDRDVTAAVADEVWLATAATGRSVEPALLADVPVEAGVLAVDASGGVTADAASVEWLPAATDAPDPHAVDCVKAGRGDGNADERTRRAARRLELAERAYDRGWRRYTETTRPDCRAFELRRHGRVLLPYCTAKGHHQRSGECSGSCPEFAPEPPAHRTRGWPIEGGPGKGVAALLDRRRRRARERAADRDG